MSETSAVAKKEEAPKARRHQIGLPKLYKLRKPYARWAQRAAIVDAKEEAKKKGTTSQGPNDMYRQNNIDLDAVREYEEWRKGGFKGAWWQRHFKYGDSE